VLAVVPAVDELTDLDHKVADRAEGAAVDGLVLDNSDPDLTRFSHDPEAGVKWTWLLGLATSQVPISTRL
jgi:hypothetical protein